jgi:hypothetical protein
MGHSAFRLADEYGYGTTMGPTFKSPNCHWNNTNLPWRHLVGR